MTAHIQAFFQAYPVSPTLNRADRWDLLKVDIQMHMFCMASLAVSAVSSVRTKRA